MLEPLPEDFKKLEAYVDAFGLACVLSMLSRICGDKAEHIATNWQDAHLAAQWERLAGTLDLAQQVAEKLGLKNGP